MATVATVATAPFDGLPSLAVCFEPDMTTETRTQRTQDVLVAPGTIDSICAFIAAGGTLAAWCKTTKRDVLADGDGGDQPLVFSLVSAWIAANDDRQKRYRSALDIREQHHKDEIIEQLRNMVTADLLQAFAEDGTLKPLKDIPPGVRHWIAGIEVDELWEGRGESREQTGIVRKIKFFDKVRSTELLMKNLKMLVDRHEVSAVSLAELLAGKPEGARS